ncbi:MAG: cytochrome-c oxidase, cbb3-type subunit III [Brachymonas sp.]
MSDFINSFWSVYVMAIVAFGILFCVAILLIGATARAHTAADNTTGHVWDGDLREINNPLPKWWVGLFWITIFFAITYLVLYPGFGTFKGILGWTSHGQYNTEMAKGDAQVAPLFAKYANMPVEEIAKDPKAVGMGQRLFLNNCAQCHGSNAKGGNGFPDLSDNDWLWGGKPDTIIQTITNGRHGQMPPMIGAIGGKPDDAKAVANYVLSLSGQPHDAALAAVGKPKFAACAACHGADGKGNQALGAPNLTDNVWLMGVPSEEGIVKQITNGKVNIMPAWGKRFSPEQIRLLGAYVWSLSNNK